MPTPATVALGAGAGAVSLAAAARVYANRVYRAGPGAEPPTKEQLAEEDLDQSALFRHVPVLKTKIAFRALGNYPTPVHRGQVTTKEGTVVEFLAKREDLASPVYGGNKVRTLQHQLAVCEAKIARGKAKRVVVLGSGGSNQVVATVTHARAAAKGLPAITAAWMDADLPDIDNTLNMLSVLSFPIDKASATWAEGAKMRAPVLEAVREGGIVLPPGGNSPAGVFGQIGGALELAEQIAGGASPDLDAIYLPIGSSCTVSGLIIGVALARKLGIAAFRRPGFRIVGVPIHHALAAGQRAVGLETAWWAQWAPITIRHTIKATCALLSSLGGPDVYEAALQVMHQQLTLEASSAIVGMYGGHSDISRAASKLYDASGKIADADGKEAQPLWLCGHFVAKAFAVMLRDYEGKRPAAGEPPRVLLWQTKSAVQPRGDLDEWERFRAMPPTIHKWGNKGVAESSLRPGSVNTKTGTPKDYRHLMSKL